MQNNFGAHLSIFYSHISHHNMADISKEGRSNLLHCRLKIDGGNAVVSWSVFEANSLVRGLVNAEVESEVAKVGNGTWWGLISILSKV